VRFRDLPLAGGILVLGSFAAFVACGFPDYTVQATSADASGDDDDGALEDAGTPCDGGAVPVGRAMTCTCGLASDAGADGETSVDAAPIEAGDGASADADAAEAATGLSACTNVGQYGACVGCPSDPGQSCENAKLPAYATCVPANIVTLGATNASVCAPSGCPLEEPEHEVALSRYFLDDHEVTVRRFRDWWKTGHVSPKPGDVVFVAGDGTTITWDTSWLVREPTKSDGTNDANWLGADDDSNDAFPVNFVDWPTALAFCVTNGGRLPTEAEWEAAASGRSGRIFPREAPGTKNVAPTVDMLPCSRAITSVGGSPCGKPQHAALDGFTVDGAYDMIGSVAEWVLDGSPHGGAACASGCYPDGPLADPLRAPHNALRGVRGGSYADTDVTKLRAQARDFADLSTQSAKLGFRCAQR
jgi:formylglycine-generating enzyme required for sulfatase activity